VTVFVNIEPPHRWARLDAQDKLVGKGEVEALAQVPAGARGERLVAVVPGRAVTIRSVTVPARSRAKALAAIPYALEDSLASDVEDLVFVLLDWKPTRPARVAIIAREQMRAWNSQLQALGSPVDMLVPDYFLVPLHPQTRYTLAATGSAEILVRGGPLEGVVLDPGMLNHWWRELDDVHTAVAVNERSLAQQLIEQGGDLVSEWSIGNDFTAWLEHGLELPANANLLQGEFKPDHQRNVTAGLKVAGVVLLSAVVLRLGTDLYDHYRLAKMDRELEANIVATFRSAFPEVTRIVNPRVQMEQKIKALLSGTTGDGEFQILLSSIARAVPASRATLEEITFRDNMMIITCTTQDFAALDRLKKRFENEPGLQAELLSSGARDERVSGRFRIAREG
jgi:general secretion pathway protein L